MMYFEINFFDMIYKHLLFFVMYNSMDKTDIILFSNIFFITFNICLLILIYIHKIDYHINL